MPDKSWKLETGSAATLALIAIAMVSTLLLTMGVAVQLSRAQLRAQLVADLSAVTASDSLIGIIAGYGCENAEEIALRNGAQLLSCRIVSSVASVRVGTKHSLLEIAREAKARGDSG